MFRFSLKVAVAGGAVYYLSKEGVWKSSDESLRVYGRLRTVLEPQYERAKQHLDFELPQLPEFDKPYGEVVKTMWNNGVLYSFQVLSELPRNLNKWSKEGYSTLIDHPEVKKLLSQQVAARPKELPNKNAG